MNCNSCLVNKPDSSPTSDTASDKISDEQIEQAIARRLAARRAKNFAESDRIRDELKAMGITLIDQPDGSTRWHR
nr:hypothetical protein [Pseudanabaena sp. PCC 6802]